MWLFWRISDYSFSSEFMFDKHILSIMVCKLKIKTLLDTNGGKKRLKLELWVEMFGI